MKDEKKLDVYSAQTEWELKKIILESLASEQDHRIQDELFKELINKYADIASILQSKIEEVTVLSETDHLTAAFNRKKLYKVFPVEEARAIRQKSNISIIMFDIDHFKKVNDNFGHDVGDKVLMGIANIVRKTIRRTDIFVRWGGEEFIVLTQDGLVGACNLAERIRQNIMNCDFPEVQKVTSSFGVAEYKVFHDTIDTLTARADDALYDAKNSGRNRVCFRVLE